MKILNEDGTARELVGGKYPAKVLNPSHVDLDGCSSTICVKNTFTDVTTVHMGYGYGIAKWYKQIKRFPHLLNDYELIIMTDLSMDEKTFAEFAQILSMAQYEGEFIFLDHHETSKPLHNPDANMFVDNTECGASLTQKYLTNTFGVELGHLDELIKYTKDYDLWVHKYKESKHVNYILDKYLSGGVEKGCERFVEKYMGGFSYKNITKVEATIIVEKLEANEKVWNELELIPYEGTSIALCMLDGSFINDMADRVLNDPELGVDVIIVFYPNGVGGSMRASARVPEINLGAFMGVIGNDNVAGGGHKLAAGYKVSKLAWKMGINEKLAIAKPEIDRIADLLSKTYKTLNQ